VAVEVAFTLQERREPEPMAAEMLVLAMVEMAQMELLIQAAVVEVHLHKMPM
jgi:hypothetical protein